MTPRRNQIVSAIMSAVVALTLLGGATGASAAGTPHRGDHGVTSTTGPTTSPTSPKPTAKPTTLVGREGGVATPSFFKPR